jgi:hypothetical protein
VLTALLFPLAYCITQTEREALLKQMADRVAEVCHEVSELQALLTRRQELLDEAVGRQDELTKALENEKRKATFSLMRMLAAAKRAKEAHERYEYEG